MKVIHKRYITCLVRALLAALSLFLLFSYFSTAAEVFAARILDYQDHLNPRFAKEIREETRFIIVHSTESSLPSALRTLSRGKVRYGRYITRGGHAHYLIAKDGTIYRILDPRYWANHAGVSMWNGLQDLSDYSIGIELEGYHNVPFEPEQYRSLKWLLDVLKRRYQIKDRNVLEHFRIAYSQPNHYHKDRLRGRKSDPGIDNFDRVKAGLRDEYPEDPDVIAGRVIGSPMLIRAGGHPSVQTGDEEEEAAAEAGAANIVSVTQTAWKIAGVHYDATTTVYKFPNGTSLRGDQIEDWSNIPSGTEVKLGGGEEKEKKVVNAYRAEVIVPEITSSLSPRKIANVLFNSSFTFYVFPDGSLHPGNTISDWPNVPVGTKILIAYRKIPRPQTKIKIGEDLDDVYLDPRTIYLFPDRSLKSGDQIDDFTKIPPGTLVFAKME